MENIKLLDLTTESAENSIITIEVSEDKTFDVEIREISTEEKAQIMQEVVNMCVSGEDFYNPFKLEIILKVKLAQYVTNIEISDEDIINDIYKTYDILNSVGIFDDEILGMIGYYDMVSEADNCAREICNFRNSFRGILYELKDGSKVNDLNDQLVDIVNSFKESPEILQLFQIATENVTNS